MTLLLDEYCSGSVGRVLDWRSKGSFNVVQDLPPAESLCSVPGQDIIWFMGTWGQCQELGSILSQIQNCGLKCNTGRTFYCLGIQSHWIFYCFAFRLKRNL